MKVLVPLETSTFVIGREREGRGVGEGRGGLTHLSLLPEYISYAQWLLLFADFGTYKYDG